MYGENPPDNPWEDVATNLYTSASRLRTAVMCDSEAKVLAATANMSTEVRRSNLDSMPATHLLDSVADLDARVRLALEPQDREFYLVLVDAIDSMIDLAIEESAK